MRAPSIKELRDELSRLMLEQIESLQTETFVGRSHANLIVEEARLKRIRELSADFLAALKEDNPLDH
jgi:N-glycosylase/DNA lyase